MRRLIAICLCFGLLSIANGQEKTNRIQALGVSGSTSILDHSIRGYLEPHLVVGTSNKQLVLAPTILVGSNLGYQVPQTPRFTGTRVGYRFWPGTIDKKWQFYLSADMRLQRLEDRWNVNLFNQEVLEYQDFNVKTVELLLENYLGYGLVYRINKSLSISQGVGIGWYLSNLGVQNGNFDNPGADVLDYRGYDNIGFILSARIELSYTW